MNTPEELAIDTQIPFEIEQELSPLKKNLNSHEIYQSLKSIKDVQIFMENHVFAVWDFMSLLKALQIELTNVSVPWTPNGNPVIVRFINEIVYGEESDIDELGQPKSHFEMYLDAMTQIKANREEIDSFMTAIKLDGNISNSLKKVRISEGVRKFTQFTFDIISTRKSHCIAAAFTYGREDIIPDMFIKVLNELDPENAHYNKLKYYLDRHVEIDGELHGPIAKNMIMELCGENQKKWDEAIEIAKNCIIKRIQLWDTIDQSIKKNNSIH
tara:strand:+ start:78 stop:887 length:810 start_codon:yes stop_codon:yes gene_type:complete